MQKENLSSYIQFSEERFTKRVIFTEGDTAVFVLNFKPGQVLPRHNHPGANLSILVVQGQGLFTIDEKEIPVTEEDVLHVNGSEYLAFTNNSDKNTSLYIVLNNIPNPSFAKNI